MEPTYYVTSHVTKISAILLVVEFAEYQIQGLTETRLRVVPRDLDLDFTWHLILQNVTITLKVPPIHIIEHFCCVMFAQEENTH